MVSCLTYGKGSNDEQRMEEVLRLEGFELLHACKTSQRFICYCEASRLLKAFDANTMTQCKEAELSFDLKPNLTVGLPKTDQVLIQSSKAINELLVLDQTELTLTKRVSVSSLL